MFRRILVPLDGSARAEAAVPVAARLARASGGTLVFVDVTNLALDYGPVLGPTPLPQEVIDRAYDETVAYLKAVVGRADLAGIATETAVLSGPVADTLLGVALAHRADLIVLNSHGRGGLVRWARRLGPTCSTCHWCCAVGCSPPIRCASGTRGRRCPRTRTSRAS